TYLSVNGAAGRAGARDFPQATIRAEAPFRGRVAFPFPAIRPETGGGRRSHQQGSGTRVAPVIRPGGARWRRSVRAGARAVSLSGAGVFACAGGALAAPAPPALLSRFLAKGRLRMSAAGRFRG